MTGATRIPTGAALAGDPDSALVDVGGFSAVETTSPEFEPDRNCVLVVDVAEGQSLVVRYDYQGTTIQMTHEAACAKAHTAAELAVQTLTQQSGPE